MALFAVLAFALSACAATAVDGPPPRAQGSQASPVEGRLATGLTEFSPYLLGPLAAPARFQRWQRLANEVRTPVVRIVVAWDQVQPSPLRPPNWTARQPGCARGLYPCAPWLGVRAQLRAVRARQLAQGTVEPLIVLAGTPRWARRSAYGCQDEDEGGELRGVSTAGLAGYRRLVLSLAALGRRERVALPWWSARNEPNSASFLTPQRLRCSPSSPSLGPGLYAPLVRTLSAALRTAPGDQRIVVGELSSPFARRPRISETAEFVRGLPRDVVCAGPVWSQHQYVGDANDLPELKRLVDARRCPGPPRRFWITETGTGQRRPGRGLRRDIRPQVLRLNCRRQHGLLLRWFADPRVDVALQYTFREDPAFTVGLADPGLDDVYPTYELWRAWGARATTDPPPPLPASCQG